MGKTAKDLAVVYRPVADLVPYARNSRTHDAAQIKRIVASIKEFSFTAPVLIGKDGGIIAGHARVMAAKKMGLKTVPTIALEHLTPAQRRAYVIADNRLAELSGWDNTILAGEFGDLKKLGFDMTLTGFDMGDISQMMTGAAGEGDDEAVPHAPKRAVTRPGDIWLCGRHRVICGDATKAADVAKLIGKTKIAMAFTDPPYGISVVRKTHKNGFDGAAKAGTYAPIIGDDSIDTALKAYAAFVDLAIPVVIMWGGNFYAHKLPPARCWIVWDKETDGNFGDGEIAWCNADKSIRIFRHKWSGMLKASEHGQARVHPTQKPVALAEWAFEEFGKGCKTVLDTFLGSASTMIACDKTGRTCFGAELAPPTSTSRCSDGKNSQARRRRWKTAGRPSTKSKPAGGKLRDAAGPRQADPQGVATGAIGDGRESSQPARRSDRTDRPQAIDDGQDRKELRSEQAAPADGMGAVRRGTATGGNRRAHGDRPQDAAQAFPRPAGAGQEHDDRQGGRRAGAALGKERPDDGVLRTEGPGRLARSGSD